VPFRSIVTWRGCDLPCEVGKCVSTRREDGVHLLVIEDDTVLADGLSQGLSASGFDVDVASDGPSGLEMARQSDYDAVVLDLMLPGLSGVAVCARLRAAGMEVPILVLTARDGESDEVESLEIGADDFLAKPFSYAVLIARLRALCRRSGGDRASLLTVGDLRLDRVTQRVRRGAVEVRLTARELALLELLMGRPGVVVAKQQILDSLWGPTFEGDSNIVEVYVRRLRNKLDRPFGRDTIQTVYGSGYRLTDDSR
jgi:two-component system, OmpR family, response regulator